MNEGAMVFLGRHVRVRGMGRLLGAMYPCSERSRRFVQGVRERNDGLKFDADTRQVIDWAQLFLGEYEAHLRPIFQTFLTSGAVAVDVGANVGAHTLTLAELVGKDGRIFAFEPNPAIRRRLERNLELNHFTQVTVHDCALGDTEGSMSLRVPAAGSDEASNPGLASLVALDTPHDLVEVAVCRLDDLLDGSIERLDLLKVDVQGFEMSVFRGMTDVLQRFRPVIVFEYEKWAWDKAGDSLDCALEFFAGHSYVVRQLGKAGTIVRAPERDDHLEMIALPCERAAER